MRTVRGTLTESDTSILPGLASVWGVDIERLATADAIDQLAEIMIDPEQANKVWDKLTDVERGALQLLVAGRAMPKDKFERVFGEIRKMGRSQITKEQPHLNSISTAESLYYKGLIAESYEQTESGLRPIIYIADDLLTALPIHQTSYSDLALEPIDEQSSDQIADAGMLEALDEEDVENIQPANTTIVDDLTTLLAYLQTHSVMVEGMNLNTADHEALSPFLLVDDVARIPFLMGMGISANLITIQDEQAYPNRSEVRRWLNASRSDQIQTLVNTWLDGNVYVDLWHVPGLFPESGWSYDAIQARRSILGFIVDFAPIDDWWVLDDFIEIIKEVEPDFQRPGSDYDSWYIRDADGNYLRGFESWHQVEAGLITTLITRTLHWLGLVDAATNVVKLNAYGRAFMTQSPFPTALEKVERVQILDNSKIFASRKVSRMDRFQLARFTTWVHTHTHYQYKLDGESIQAALRHKITTEHIAAFLTRQLDGEPLPSSIADLLQAWQGRQNLAVTFETLLVLRTTSMETMDEIYNDPPLRRHLGSRLGPMAAIIRAGEWEQLKEKLGEEGIRVEMYSNDE